MACQWKWYVEQVQGNRIKEHSIHMAFGTAIHHAIEHLKNKDISKRVATAVAKELFLSKLLEEESKFKDSLKQIYDLSVFVESGERIIDHIDDVPELRDSVVASNELELLEDIDRSDDLKMKFKGFVDFIVKMPAKRGKKSILYVLDFKTCSWGWTNDDKNDPHKQLQLLLYKHFICKKFGIDPKDVRTAFVLLKKRPRPANLRSGRPADSPIEVVHVSSGPKTMERAVETLQSTISEMHSGVYEKNTKSCINKFKNVCVHYKTERCDARV